MRLFLAALVIILGANFGIELMNSNLVDVMQERKSQVEKAMNRM